ncbi:MAG: hypothetical protein ABR582_01980 [Gemmatimonadaceae bacterium]
MSVASFIEFQQIVHNNYLATLPALSTLALAAPILWLVLVRREYGCAEFKIVLAATLDDRFSSRIDRPDDGRRGTAFCR